MLGANIQGFQLILSLVFIGSIVIRWLVLNHRPGRNDITNVILVTLGPLLMVMVLNSILMMLPAVGTQNAIVILFFGGVLIYLRSRLFR